MNTIITTRDAFIGAEKAAGRPVMVLKLPVPHADLWPNGRPNRWEKAKLTRQHRQRAFFATLGELGVANLPKRILHKDKKAFGITGPLNDKAYRHIARLLDPNEPPRLIHYQFTFVTYNRVDEDNAPASTKAYLDGIADALRVNDRDFSPSPVLRHSYATDRKNQSLTITLHT